MDQEQNFIVLDARGYQLRYHENLQPPFYEGVPIPYCNIQKSKIFCTPCDAVQEKANNDNLILSIIYMAQSAAGRAAIQTLSGNGIADNHIRIGYDETFQRKNTPQAGYRDGAAYILLDPKTPPEIQHLVLIQQAAQFEITMRLVARPMGALPQAAQLIARASVAYGLIALFDHGQECLANRKENPLRFVPPQLESTMGEILSNQASAIPNEPAMRAAYKQRLLSELGLDAAVAPGLAPDKPGPS